MLLDGSLADATFDCDRLVAVARDQKRDDLQLASGQAVGPPGRRIRQSRGGARRRCVNSAMTSRSIQYSPAATALTLLNKSCAVTLLSTMPRTPRRSASRICEWSSPDVSIITRAGAQRMINLRNAPRSGAPMCDMSAMTTSDRQARAASAQPVAEPTTRKPDSLANSSRRPSRLMAYSPRRNSRIEARRGCGADWTPMGGGLGRLRFTGRLSTDSPPLDMPEDG